MQIQFPNDTCPYKLANVLQWQKDLSCIGTKCMVFMPTGKNEEGKVVGGCSFAVQTKLASQLVQLNAEIAKGLDDKINVLTLAVAEGLEEGTKSRFFPGANVFRELAKALRKLFAATKDAASAGVPPAAPTALAAALEPASPVPEESNVRELRP
jgi:hypothetical protein